MRLHYVSGGSGPAVVLLHGWPYSWAEWRGVMPLLARAGYTVIAPDLRGIGDSSKPDDPHLKRDAAEDVHQLVRSLGHDGIRLVGTDIGTMVAYAYAAAYPDEVQRLVLSEAPVPGFGLEELCNYATGGYWHFGFHAQADIAEALTRDKEALYLGQWYDMGSVVPGAIVPAERAEYTRTYAAPGGMRGGFQYYAALLDDGRYNRDVFRELLSMPVLTLNGDKGAPQEQTLSSARRVASDVRAVVIPDCGHAISADQPAAVADSLLSFFAADES